MLVLTTFDDDEALAAALRNGACGFIFKDASAEDLIRAVHTVAKGGAWLDPGVTSRVLSAFGRSKAPRASSALSELTTREREVIRLLGRGASNLEIAQALGISETTVKTHVGNILSKLNLRDRAAAIVFAFDHGLNTPG